MPSSRSIFKKPASGPRERSPVQYRLLLESGLKEHFLSLHAFACLLKMQHAYQCTILKFIGITIAKVGLTLLKVWSDSFLPKLALRAIYSVHAHFKALRFFRSFKKTFFG